MWSCIMNTVEPKVRERGVDHSRTWDKCSTVIVRLQQAILVCVISWLVLLGIERIIWWWTWCDAVLWLCWSWDTLFYNCTNIHNWLLPVESLKQLVAPKDQVTDRVSRINVWMPSNGSLLKYSHLVCDAL